VIERTLDSISAAAGAEVMGIGIVSLALSLDGQETLSRILLVIAVVMWMTLAILVPARATRDRGRFATDLRTPAAPTSVAGAAVVGTGLVGTGLALLGWDWVGVALLLIATALWAALLAPVLANWTTPTIGASLMLTVSTESLAVLAATLAAVEHARWLLVAALAPFGLGLVFYVFVISRFDPRQLGVGAATTGSPAARWRSRPSPPPRSPPVGKHSRSSEAARGRSRTWRWDCGC
jgi:tellurite resistance protein TehA-like permease